MHPNYKRLGKYIKPVNVRNTKLEVDTLLGVSIKKILMPSIANTIGTDMSKYKVIRRKQFAYGPVTSRNGNKISVALLEENDAAIVSQAYTVFEITDHTELDPEYLMMWFRRPEYDRYARFKSHGSAREIFDWDELCDTELPIPSIQKQHEIVKEYNTIVKRIKLNEQLNQKLEETAQAIYKEWFENEGNLTSKRRLSDLCSLITDGKHGDCINESESGYYFLSAKDLRNNTLIYKNARQIRKSEFEETHRRTNLKPKDICMVNTGATIGRMSIAPNNDKTIKTTFQKSVAIIKANKDVCKEYYLYSLLKYNIREITELGRGTSQPNLLLGDLRKFEINYPNMDIINRFEYVITPFFEKQFINTQLNLILNELKELLLSKMSNN